MKTPPAAPNRLTLAEDEDMKAFVKDLLRQRQQRPTPDPPAAMPAAAITPSKCW
jgi:hypothetical protein